MTYLSERLNNPDCLFLTLQTASCYKPDYEFKLPFKTAVIRVKGQTVVNSSQCFPECPAAEYLFPSLSPPAGLQRPSQAPGPHFSPPWSRRMCCANCSHCWFNGRFITERVFISALFSSIKNSHLPAVRIYGVWRANWSLMVPTQRRRFPTEPNGACSNGRPPSRRQIWNTSSPRDN